MKNPTRIEVTVNIRIRDTVTKAVIGDSAVRTGSVDGYLGANDRKKLAEELRNEAVDRTLGRESRPWVEAAE